MPSVYEIQSIGAAIAFLAWTLAVVALTKALFGSFPAMELSWWLHQRSAPRRERIAQLDWEVKHGQKWDPDVAQRSPHAAPQSLTTAEHERKRAELASLVRGSIAQRAGSFFASCFACQSFWAAALLYTLTRGLMLDVPVSALAYSGAAVAVTTLARLRTESMTERSRPRTKSGCAGCGG